jgi:AcrR family transcriptional regulator
MASTAPTRSDGSARASARPDGEAVDTLRERLVETALALVAEEGLKEISLRRIARSAGVSHGAPLRHFRSYADLLAEVAARGFALLSASIEASSAVLPAGADPVARLAAAARGYVHAAVENAGLFALMFRPGDLDVTNAAFMRESGAAFEHVVRHVREAQAAGWHEDRDTRVLAAATWACVHGLATLWSQGAFVGPVPGATLEDAVDTMLELVL